jgi:hypothetical protein
MLLWETMLWLLVRADGGYPLNAPAGLFDRAAVQIPGEWQFAVRPGAAKSGRALWDDPLVAVWGYSQLVNDPSHGDDLFGGETTAVAIFEMNLGRSRDDA